MRCTALRRRCRLVPAAERSDPSVRNAFGAHVLLSLAHVFLSLAIKQHSNDIAACRLPTLCLSTVGTGLRSLAVTANAPSRTSANSCHLFACARRGALPLGRGMRSPASQMSVPSHAQIFFVLSPATALRATTAATFAPFVLCAACSYTTSALPMMSQTCADDGGEPTLRNRLAQTVTPAGLGSAPHSRTQPGHLHLFR